MVYFIVDKVITPLTKVKNYRGMNRGGAYFNEADSSDSVLVNLVEDVCEYYDTDQEKEAIEVFQRVKKNGHDNFELIALNKVADESKWHFLGYDVGEDDESRWSAIVKHYDYLIEEEFLPWKAKLNGHGLFNTLDEARKFRKFYLSSNDPVLKEVTDKEKELIYDIFKIFLYMEKSGIPPRE